MKLTLGEFVAAQQAFSEKTFGPGKRTKGLIDHITKELAEIAKEPDDLSEWIDVIILALDGYWRHGGDAAAIDRLLWEKFNKNRARDWPDWRTVGQDKAIEHKR